MMYGKRSTVEAQRLANIRGALLLMDGVPDPEPRQNDTGWETPSQKPSN
jgi:hypothetical protein